MRSHSNFAKIIDRTNTARFFLESYVADVMRQLQAALNDPTSSASNAYQASRKSAAGTTISLPYSPCDLLGSMAKELEIDLLPPEISLEDIATMSYPPMMSVPNPVEREGRFRIRCEIELDGSGFETIVHFREKTVMAVSPLLREFVFYSDQISLEQPEPAGPRDMLNVIRVKGSKAMDGKSCWEFPWRMFPGRFREPNPDGRVFLGKDSSKIFLNMAGEYLSRLGQPLGYPCDQGEMCDLRLVKPVFLIPSAEKGFVSLTPPNSSPFSKEDGTGLLAREFVVDRNFHLVFLGFSDEISKRGGGIFTKSPYQLDDYLKDDPLFRGYFSNLGSLAFSTSLKFKGRNELPKSGRGGELYDGASSRVVFGNVYHRFIILGLIEIASANLLPIPYSDRKVDLFQAPRKSGLRANFTIPPPSGESSFDLMSRIISGGGPGNRFVSVNQCLPDRAGGQPVSSQEKQGDRIMDFRRFSGTDGLRLSRPFSDFAKEWFGAPSAQSSVFARICRFFPSQDEFKRYSCVMKDGKMVGFRLGGVFYVEGDVDLDPIDFPSDRILGGTLIAGGKITFRGNVSRGITLPESAETGPEIDRITQDTFLTFVSLKPSLGGGRGECFVLQGDRFYGIQLVALSKDELEAPEKMVVFGENGKKVVLWGGLAVSTPNMSEQVRRSEPVVFQYVPKMSGEARTFVYVSRIPDAFEFSALD